ncbi:MAG: sulfite exporter TauE/SafE family protein [Solirubrobacterales bacterium]|nr:sulfite exporter TauE/SafE family protein [Solirubrobacterales bacterium]
MPRVNDPGTLRLALVGICAGLLSGLLGVGGGVIIVPLLVLWLGWNQRSAQATSLAAVFIIASYGVVAFGLHGEVRPVTAALIGLPALAGVVFGTRLAAKLHSDTLGILFGLFQVTVAIVMFAG